MRNGILERDEKVRAVLVRRGRPGNDIARFSEDELNQLAALYDAHCHPETELAGNFDKFWASHHERLEADKATMAADDPSLPATGKRSLVRNKKSPQPAIDAKPATEAEPPKPAETTVQDPAQPVVDNNAPMTPLETVKTTRAWLLKQGYAFRS